MKLRKEAAARLKEPSASVFILAMSDCKVVSLALDMFRGYKMERCSLNRRDVPGAIARVAGSPAGEDLAVIWYLAIAREVMSVNNPLANFLAVENAVLLSI